MQEITKSPIDQTALKPYLKCQDHLVSNKIFELKIDTKNQFLVTSPQPKAENLAAYYQSKTYISHTDANKSLFDKIYQKVKKYTLNQKLKLINSFQTSEKTLLDIGCGTGDFLKHCQNNNWIVTGVEPNTNARDLANQKLQTTLHSVLEDVQNTYDVITLWHVLEHVADLDGYISQLKKLLKPNGRLVIAVPNFQSYDAQHYKSFWAAYDVPRHLWHFSKKSIQNLLHQYHFELETIKPMRFDSYYVSLLSEKNKTGKSNPIKAFYTGWLSNLKAAKKMNYSSHIYIFKQK